MLPVPHPRFTLSRLSLLLGLLLLGFRSTDDPAYKTQLDQWHQARLTSLKTEEGWLNLAGLFWLHEGDNTVGGGKANEVAFPETKAVARLGRFSLQNERVEFYPAPNAPVALDGKPVTEPLLVFGPEAKPLVLQSGSLRWFIIKRAAQYGVRLRDLAHPALAQFKGIERFAADTTWRLNARLDVPAEPKTIAITDVLGLTSQQPLAGTLVFERAGKTYRLDATGGKKLFVIFRDQTSGAETYGAGRFLYADLPGPDGTTTLDFNQAINPPCAFSEYATCPLPPKQNSLPLRVTAGEKTFGHH